MAGRTTMNTDPAISILIPWKNAAGAGSITRTKAEALERAKMVGRMFRDYHAAPEALQRKYNESGENKGIPSSMEKKLAEVKPGTMSEPMESPEGYWLVFRKPGSFVAPSAQVHATFTPDAPLFSVARKQVAASIPASSPASADLGHSQFRALLISYQGAAGAPKSMHRSQKAAAELAQAIRDKAAPQHFIDLVKRYSDDPNKADGGMVEGLQADAIPTSLAGILRALRPGEISQVIQSPMGYHLFYRER